MSTVKSAWLFVLALFVWGCSNSDEKSDNTGSEDAGVDTANSEEPSTGMVPFQSQDINRDYYLKLPDDYSEDSNHPLVIAFHGTGGDHTSYTLNSYYNLHGAVEEDAILVYPNAVANDNGVTQWDYETDLTFFDDLMIQLNATIKYDVNKVFLVGHSSGAGLIHMLGCRRGDLVRAIGPVAGALLQFDECIGQVAVIQIQGSKDTMVPPNIVAPGRDYWVSINSCTPEDPIIEPDTSCAAYQDCDSDFPVEYCEHDLEDHRHDYPGHAWPEFAGDTIWTFFTSLSDVEPSKDKGTGGMPATMTGVATFKMSFPADFVGTPDKLALGLYPKGFDWNAAIEVAPIHILNSAVPLGEYVFGETIEYKEIPVTLDRVNFGAEYVANVVVYVEGGNYPIPTTGEDYVAFQVATIEGPVFVLETVFELQPLKSF